ncbi:uncharacterized protein EV154DRAFT_415461 [Mucor mucedo]|uniref:uncharacterized protein n=1 Tax=Mucor mucedo TaxID=29922 RepID=UPI0022200F7B|nr:uncharacterized protein EV154DRAFT_415461 [Mucor mucedo]KAI7894266.1 hypothetical protein EV154DRAFT_415461 [Mucor mucedo]
MTEEAIKVEPPTATTTTTTTTTAVDLAANLLPVDLASIPLPEEDPQRYVSLQTHDIIIPSYAAWFDITTVNRIESKALPEFFNDRNKSKTPTVYKEYRDFMINTYRMNPIEYLTITACRRNLTGDVCAILRVHSFLEQWGLINYQVDPEAKLSSLSPPFDSQYKVVIDQPSEEAEYKQKEEEEEEEKETRVKVDDVWEEEEESLLKEGLGLFGDDWEKVSNHVGTRTHDECILHYLQLPMNDPFHDVEVEKLGLLQYDAQPHRENPIMAAVAFLASSVEPQVAAAAGDIQTFQIVPASKEEMEMMKSVKSETEESDLCELTNTLIRHKLTQYQQQASHYGGLESMVEEQKIQLEKEKRQLEQDQGAFKRKVLFIRQEMAKRISKANAIASIITPAQLQQQLAGGGHPAMFLNGNQRHQHPQQHQHQQLQQQQMQQQHQSPQALQQLQLQQQQYQLQMQMQMQQQARPNGPNYNNMMSL